MSKQSPITPAMAAKEIIRRDRAKESLLDYAKYITIPGKPVSEKEDEWVFSPVETGLAAHHALVLKVFEDLVNKVIPRAMIFMPPGSAKSTYGSTVGPTWAMGKIPGYKLILTSYGSELAKKHGRKARQIVRSPEFKAVFETELSKETGAADFWTTKAGSEYMSGGILSGITGNRANGLIIDDPVKGRQEADSEVTQQRTWEAYNDDLRTRLIPGGWELIIQTRWSENDISGKILPENYDGRTGLIDCRDGRQWYVLCLPAQHQEDFPPDPLGREPGEYLWQEWFTPEHFEGFKSIRRTWSALFQQRPAADDGTFFRRDWFADKRFRVGGHPQNISKYMVSDHAPAGEENSDPNCVRIWGVDEVNDLWMLGGFNKKETLEKVADKALNLIRAHKPYCWFPEDDNNWKSAAPFIKRQMIKEKTYCRIEPISPHGQDKPTKAQAFQAMASMGCVHIPEGPEGDEIIEQYIKFPAGAHDEEVDVGAIIGRAIDMAHPAIVKKVKEVAKTQAEEDWNKVMKSDKGAGGHRYGN
jgi:predicted phage terminase large subunit-like protein